MRPILEIRNYTAGFATDRGPVVVVDGVSLSNPHGQTVALVGESGCGKSVTALSILRLLPVPPAKILGGEIIFEDDRSGGAIDLVRAPVQQMRKIRGGRIAMIFQDPMSALNPVYTIGEQIIETVDRHTPRRRLDAKRWAIDMLARVGIAAPQRRFDEYPHQMSGGMLQRVMIAMALCCEPVLLIADEPTTALDVTVQAQVLQLLKDCRQDRRMSLLVITHDLGVVAELADRVYIMYAGRIVEHGPTRRILENPLHPYTRGLIRCLPRLGASEVDIAAIPGFVPEAGRYPAGCRFHPRCELSVELARRSENSQSVISTTQGTNVLRRCVEGETRARPTELRHFPVASTAPLLRSLESDHFVACWEAEATSIDKQVTSGTAS